MAVGCSQEHDGIVAGRRGRYSREVRVEDQHGHGGYGLLATQRRVHIQAAEVLSYRLQLLQHATVPHLLVTVHTAARSNTTITLRRCRLTLYTSGIETGVRVPPEVREDILGCT